MNASLAAAKDISIECFVRTCRLFHTEKPNTSSFFGGEYVLDVLLTTGFGNSVVRSCGGSPESDERSLMCSFALIENLQLHRLNWQKKKEEEEESDW